MSLINLYQKLRKFKQMDYKKAINDFNKICDGLINPKEKSIRTENNYFLISYITSSFFKDQTLIKIKSLYDTYKDNQYYKDVIIDIINKLFYYNWEGAYSELTTYYFLNLCFEEKCELQIQENTNGLTIKNTLARYFENKKFSDIDGFNKQLGSFFEIKSLENDTKSQLEKLKKELFNHSEIKNQDFKFTFNSKDGFKIKNYNGVKKEIEQGKKELLEYIEKQNQENKERPQDKQRKVIKKLVINSKTNPGLTITLCIDQIIVIEFQMEETSFQKAEMLELKPLENPYQFVDGSFMKIFVCTGLNARKEINYDRDFARALSRRVFIKLAKDHTPIKGTKPQLTRSDISKHLCGLLFITDLSANKEYVRDLNDQKALYRAFAYLNPNAKYKHTEYLFRQIRFYLRNLNWRDVDDFRFDNY